jgi:hypothetical protein
MSADEVLAERSGTIAASESLGVAYDLAAGVEAAKAALRLV